MKNIISIAFVIGGLMTQGYAYADSRKCDELSEALEAFTSAQEALSNAWKDNYSISRKDKALPIVKELAKRREELKEERVAQALLNLRSSLSSAEVAKDWQIPDYNRPQNKNYVIFYTLATDVVCMGG